jgi:hypothetical protein
MRHFNSRRLYNAKGQVIAWEVRFNAAGAPVVYFADLSRRVTGVVLGDCEDDVRDGYLNGNRYSPSDAEVEWSDLYAWENSNRDAFKAIHDSYPNL